MQARRLLRHVMFTIMCMVLPVFLVFLVAIGSVLLGRLLETLQPRVCMDPAACECMTPE